MGSESPARHSRHPVGARLPRRDDPRDRVHQRRRGTDPAAAEQRVRPRAAEDRAGGGGVPGAGGGDRDRHFDPRVLRRPALGDDPAGRGGDQRPRAARGRPGDPPGGERLPAGAAPGRPPSTPTPSRSTTSRRGCTWPVAPARSRRAPTPGTSCRAWTCWPPGTRSARSWPSATRSRTASAPRRAATRAGPTSSPRRLDALPGSTARRGRRGDRRQPGPQRRAMLRPERDRALRARRARAARRPGCDPARRDQRHRLRPEPRPAHRPPHRGFPPADRRGLRADRDPGAHRRLEDLRRHPHPVPGRALLDPGGRSRPRGGEPLDPHLRERSTG